jgi:hypothetical protein
MSEQCDELRAETPAVGPLLARLGKAATGQVGAEAGLRRRLQNFAAAGAAGGGDEPLLLHSIDDVRGAVIANR